MSEKLIIIGGGPGGYIAALRGAALGAKVTLIEQENLGGTCLNWGCIPSKIFCELGCKVTIVEAMSRLLPLPSVDEVCSKLLLREMKKRKIKVLCDIIVTNADTTGDGVAISLAPSPFTDNPTPPKLKTDGIQSQVMAVCIGRTPLSDGLGLENIGLSTTGPGWIEVNEQMETPVENVYAIGDILGPEKIMLAHVASHEGLVAAQNAMKQKTDPKLTMAYDLVPGAIFTSPEIGTVDLSEKQAIATDLIAEATLAIEKGLTAKEIAHTIHAHPTLSEIMGEVASKAMGMPFHG